MLTLVANLRAFEQKHPIVVKLIAAVSGLVAAVLVAKGRAAVAAAAAVPLLLWVLVRLASMRRPVKK